MRYLESEIYAIKLEKTAHAATSKVNFQLQVNDRKTDIFVPFIYTSLY